MADALARHVAALAGRSATVYLRHERDGSLIALARSGAETGTPDRLSPDAAPADGAIVRPIGRGPTPVGMVWLSAPVGKPEPADDTLTSLIVELAAGALERVRLRAERRVAKDAATAAAGRVASLARLAADLVGATTVDEVARTLVDLAIDDLGAGFAALHVPHDTIEGFRLAYARGYPEGLIAQERFVPLETATPLTRAATDGAIVEVVDGDQWRREFPRASDVLAITGTRAITAIPMQAGGVSRGVLVIGWRTAAGRAAADRDLLATAADQGAQALERAMLHAHDEDARRLQEAFVGVISHELRTPITTILAGARLLRRRLEHDPRSAELSEDIAAEADRLSWIVDDLLVLSRLERRHLEAGDEPVHLDHLTARVVGSEAGHWPNHRFVLPTPSGSHVVRGDETYIEQVLRNLVSNAAKYSPPASTVAVEIDDASPEGVRVRVLDEGPGVSPDEVDELFTLFYRSPRTAGTASGAGIGLFVSLRLVTEMGGRIWAQPRPSGGSEFGFVLGRYPFDDDEAEADLGEAEPETAADEE